ncbi:helix-turn-helix domain-containing protein [Amycolatopsis thermophila]|uniref:helix-turn-helix domain-containing protein n=1 Tax=Amycolatopsis thermophila TaxID=206084 RepID=UPI003521521C
MGGREAPAVGVRSCRRCGGRFTRERPLVCRGLHGQCYDHARAVGELHRYPVTRRTIDREEMARLEAAGLSTGEIAERFRVSPGAVRVARHRLRRGGAVVPGGGS